MATLDNRDAGLRSMDKMAKPARDRGRSYRDFSLFLNEGLDILLTIARGEWAMSSFCALDLSRRLPALSAHRAPHVLKHLGTHGLIKKVGHCVVATTRVLRKTVITPSFAQAVQ